MLALAALNALGAAAFGFLYLAAAHRLLTQGAFLAGLVTFFVAITALWVRVERSRGPDRDPLSRAGRIAVGLVVTVIAVPGVVLMPLFFLHEHLPPEAGLGNVVGPVMFILLASLALVVLVNVAGLVFMAGSVLAGRLSGRRG